MKSLLVLVCLVAFAGRADACRLALALALDVSGSVDAREYQLQVNGLATALDDPDVRTAIFAMEGAPVALAIYEWSSSKYQRIVQDWIVLETPEQLSSVTAHLRNWTRAPAPEATGIGAALIFGRDMIARAPPCWQSTLDVSGDGQNNDWPIPRDLQRQGVLGALRINGLVVAATDGDAAELSAYYSAYVIRGPDAFVEVAIGFGDYAKAMRRKLLRELATQPLGHAIPPQELRLQLVRQ